MCGRQDYGYSWLPNFVECSNVGLLVITLLEPNDGAYFAVVSNEKIIIILNCLERSDYRNKYLHPSKQEGALSLESEAWKSENESLNFLKGSEIFLERMNIYVHRLYLEAQMTSAY